MHRNEWFIINTPSQRIALVKAHIVAIEEAPGRQETLRIRMVNDATYEIAGAAFETYLHDICDSDTYRG
jgi:hypothetical protein